MARHEGLTGCRVAVLAADGFEKVELTIPAMALGMAGAVVDVVSLRRGRIRGVNLHEPAGRVHVDRTVAEADAGDYDALYVPGGFINPDLLRQSADARSFVRGFDLVGKPIASMCHGPWVLASAGCLKGRTVTSWPGIRDDIVNAGAIWLDQNVVRDGNLVTSRGPQDLWAFIQAMKELFAERLPIRRSARPATISSPQRTAPPQLVISAMKWMPRPSFRTVFGVGAIVAALAATAPPRERHATARSPRSGSEERTPAAREIP